MQTTLTNYRRPTETARAAIERAATEGLTPCAYESPTESAREGLSVSEAAEIAGEDPGLIYLAADPSLAADHLRDTSATLLSSLRRAAEAEQRFLAEYPDQDTWDLVAAADARDLTEAAGCRWDFVSWADALECAEAGELGGVVI